MPDKFDAYREALIMETNTVWPDDYDDLEEAEKQRTEIQRTVDIWSTFASTRGFVAKSPSPTKTFSA